jgi:Ca2+-binding RTX toxin-like protein
MRKTGLVMASVALAVLLICGVALAATVNCVSGAELCEGTEEGDTLKGTQGEDHMNGLAGEDKLYGKEGRDNMRGGLGNDTLHGGPGRDVAGIDTADEPPPGESPMAGYDTFYGGDGKDFFLEREGRNRVSGGSGDDWLISRGTLLGDAGDDRVEGRTRLEEPHEEVPIGTLRGGSGDDFMYLAGSGRAFGGLGDDTFDRRGPCLDICVTNGAGPRVLEGGPGNDELRLFGPHDDTIYLTDGERDRVISCGGGTDTIYFDRGLDKIRMGASCGERHPQ